MKIRYVLLLIAAPILATAILAGCARATADGPTVTVFKSPTCNCCKKWVRHLEKNGFQIKTTDMPSVMPMKNRLGVPQALSSCHTAVVDGYVVEGHVPADVVTQLLADRPDITGIAVPGIPIGSPGMAGRNPQSYDILAFNKRGTQDVYATR